jgi:hypothetical protein
VWPGLWRRVIPWQSSKGEVEKVCQFRAVRER